VPERGGSDPQIVVVEPQLSRGCFSTLGAFPEPKVTKERRFNERSRDGNIAPFIEPTYHLRIAFYHAATVICIEQVHAQN
jgi:hypothetical protein